MEAILTKPEISVKYCKTIGPVAKPKLSVIPALFQVIFCTVPCFHASPPFGAMIVFAETVGAVESMVNWLFETSFDVLATWSTAVIRTVTVLELIDGTVQLNKPSFASPDAIGFQFEP